MISCVICKEGILSANRCRRGYAQGMAVRDFVLVPAEGADR